MSPHFNSKIFPHIYEANVANLRAGVEERRQEAARQGRVFKPEDHEQIFIGINKETLVPEFVGWKHLLVCWFSVNGKN